MNATVESKGLTPPTGQEDGSDPARPLHLHLLRQGHCQETLRRHLGLQVLQEDCCWWRLHRLVRFSLLDLQDDESLTRIWTTRLTQGLHSTPAAAATRSTIRRLREIAEV